MCVRVNGYNIPIECFTWRKERKYKRSESIDFIAHFVLNIAHPYDDCVRASYTRIITRNRTNINKGKFPFRFEFLNFSLTMRPRCNSNCRKFFSHCNTSVCTLCHAISIVGWLIQEEKNVHEVCEIFLLSLSNTNVLLNLSMYVADPFVLFGFYDESAHIPKSKWFSWFFSRVEIIPLNNGCVCIYIYICVCV